MRKTSVSRKIFVVFNTIFLCTLALLCFLPLLNLFAISLSGKAAANSGRVTFWPIDFTVMAYQKTFQNNNFVRSLMISFARTIVGTAVSMGVITMAGYALSRDFKGRTAIMWFFVFTMLFGGGLIPSYLVNSSLGLKNSFWVYILPGAFSCYNMILIMNFFRTIPKALEEAARIDGAGVFRIFGTIVLPLLKPMIATIVILNTLNVWNDFMGPLLYLDDRKLKTVSLALQNFMGQHKSDWNQMMATATVITIPMIVVYFMAQKYFIEGITFSGLKG